MATTGENFEAAAKTVVETAQTKKGRLGYILIFALGFVLGFVLKWAI